MTIMKLSNGGALVEERFSFPDPDLTIRTVFRFDDIKYLKARISEMASIVYFYGDRDYYNNLTHYTGETQNSPLSRYKSTHSKKDWCKNLKYPLIGMAESSVTPWDMDTRKTIEALCAFKMKQMGFNVINADTINWSHGVIIPPTVNSVYAESVANLLIAHQVSLLGLSGFDVKALAKEQGYQFEEEEDLTPDENIRFSLNDFASPNRIKAEEKFKALIKSGRIVLGEPLYTNHKLVHKAVNLRSPDSVEYRGVLYTPREALKAMAHEAYIEGATQRQVDGWSAYDPLMMFCVDRLDERVRLLDLWNEIKPTELLVDEAPVEAEDEWYSIVMSNSLVGASLHSNGFEALIGENAVIEMGEDRFVSLTAFGEAVKGLDEAGQGSFTLKHGGEVYTLRID